MRMTETQSDKHQTGIPAPDEGPIVEPSDLIVSEGEVTNTSTQLPQVGRAIASFHGEGVVWLRYTPREDVQSGEESTQG